MQKALIVSIGLVGVLLFSGLLSYTQFQSIMKDCHHVNDICFTNASNLAILTPILFVLCMPSIILPSLFFDEIPKLTEVEQ